MTDQKTKRRVAEGTVLTTNIGIALAATGTIDHNLVTKAGVFCGTLLTAMTIENKIYRKLIIRNALKDAQRDFEDKEL